jgi:hypothetical protein
MTCADGDLGWIDSLYVHMFHSGTVPNELTYCIMGSDTPRKNKEHVEAKYTTSSNRPSSLYSQIQKAILYVIEP